MLYGGNSMVPVAGAVLIAGYITKDQNIRDGIFGCAASYAANSQLRHQIFYRFINRRRPVPGKDGGDTIPPAQHGDQYDISISMRDSSWGNNSFPGGHVANIMACATSLSTRFDLGAGEPLLYGFAAAVGVGRIIDRGHWASDQLVGVVFAYAIGREVAMRQRKRLERSREEGVAVLTEIPRSARPGFYIIRDESRGIGLGWQRNF
jgi:membrane-associated phospholipid phosphatase